MGSIRVLLVDDEKDFTDVLSERMQMRGLKVDICDNGKEAVSTAARLTYDAVVMDLAMPEMDGIAALKEMLRNNPDIQVILLTGHGSIEKSAEAFRSGALDFLEKPPDIEKLITKIQTAKQKHDRLSEESMEKTLKDIMLHKGW